MAVIGTLTKQPREARTQDISYTQFLDGRTATAISATVETPAGMTLAFTDTDLDTSRVKIGVAGGAAGQVYKWTVLTTLTIGGRQELLEDEFYVVVEEVSADSSAGVIDAVATVAGTTAPVISKRAADDRTYIVECSALLRKFELVTAVASLSADTGLTVSGQAVEQGSLVRFSASGGTVPQGQPSIDYTVRITVTTTNGQVQANVTVRVYP